MSSPVVTMDKSARSLGRDPFSDDLTGSPDFFLIMLDPLDGEGVLNEADLDAVIPATPGKMIEFLGFRAFSGNGVDGRDGDEDGVDRALARETRRLDRVGNDSSSELEPHASKSATTGRRLRASPRCCFLTTA